MKTLNPEKLSLEQTLAVLSNLISDVDWDAPASNTDNFIRLIEVKAMIRNARVKLSTVLTAERESNDE